MIGRACICAVLLLTGCGDETGKSSAAPPDGAGLGELNPAEREYLCDSYYRAGACALPAGFFVPRDEDPSECLSRLLVPEDCGATVADYRNCFDSLQECPAQDQCMVETVCPASCDRYLSC